MAMSQHVDKKISLDTKKSGGKCISKSIATHDSVLLPHHSALQLIIQTTNNFHKLPNQQAPASKPITNMQFILSIIALAAAATALPAASQAADATGFTNYDGERVLISLPSGCTKKDLASKSSPDIEDVNVNTEADHEQSVFCTWSAPLAPAAPLLSKLAPTRLPTFLASALLPELPPTSMSASTAFPSRWRDWRKAVRVQGCWACSGAPSLD